MFGIGGFELFIILIFGFLIFGPEKLPEIAKVVGKGIARFRQAQDEMNGVIKSTDIYDPNSDEPFKDPMQALDKLARHQEEKKAAAKRSESKAQASSASAGAGAAAKPAASAQPVKASASADAQKTADAAPSAPASADTPRQESFTERKARYERERAARKAQEQAAGKTGTADQKPASGTAQTSAAQEKPAGESAATTEGGDE